jgi:predicted small integral membrane protein
MTFKSIGDSVRKKKVNSQQLLGAVIISVLEFLSSLEYNDRHILLVYPCVMDTMNSDREKKTSSIVTRIYQQIHFFGIPVCNVYYVSIFIIIKQCLMPNYICIPYLSILQIIKFTSAHTTQQ